MDKIFSSICTNNHKNISSKDIIVEYFENENRKIEVSKCKFCGEDISLKTVKNKLKLVDENIIENAPHNCKRYECGVCKLDNNKCYLKKLYDSGVYFDCYKLAKSDIE